MLYVDKGKSFLIPTETTQCAKIWDLIKPVLLLQMLQLFITFSRPLSIQHGIHIYSLLWLRSPPAQPHSVRQLLWMNTIYWPFYLIFFIQHHARQKSIAFLMMSPTSGSHLQVHMDVGWVMIEKGGWEEERKSLKRCIRTSSTMPSQACLDTLSFPACAKLGLYL